LAVKWYSSLCNCYKHHDICVFCVGWIHQKIFR
jgi:hypothetical protein